jgi:biotin carboxylase
MSKTLLVLAASRYQLDAIQMAKKLGHRVITTDNVPSNPGHALADRAYHTDTTALDAVLRIAQEERIDGIISPCTDVSVPTAAYVAESMHLPGSPLKAARIVTDKIAFRRFLEEHDLPRPAYFALARNESPPADLFERSPAWIIKPDRSSGSKGIFVIRDERELDQRVAESRTFSPTGTVLIEEFFEGHQGTVEGVLKEGRIALHFFLDRQTPAEPFVTTIGHHVPTVLTAQQQQLVLDHMADVWSRLGVRDGVFDCDFVCSGDVVHLLEMTPRLGGNSISRLVQLSSGYDLVEHAVRSALGEDLDLPDQMQLAPMAVRLFGVWTDGTLALNLSELEALRHESWIESLSLDVAPGSPVEVFKNGRNRVGEAFLSAPDRHSLSARVAELEHRLQLRAV